LRGEAQKVKELVNTYVYRYEPFYVNILALDLGKLYTSDLIKGIHCMFKGDI